MASPSVDKAEKSRRPDDKWEAQLRKGCLEMAVLATLACGRLYGLEILRLLETNSHLVLSEGTVYPILNRLKQEGLLEAEWVEAELGHPRKYYGLTRKGRQQATAMALAWMRFSSDMTVLVEPLLKNRRSE